MRAEAGAVTRRKLAALSGGVQKGVAAVADPAAVHSVEVPAVARAVLFRVRARDAGRVETRVVPIAHPAAVDLAAAAIDPGAVWSGEGQSHQKHE